MDVLEPRQEFSFRGFEAAVLAIYSLLVSVLVWYHEPWSDEAQAWLIARDSSFPDLFLHRLHYEGTPGLWHALLWIACRLHLSYAAMHWAVALLSIATVYILLRYGPFPLLVRGLLPFCFALVFQTAVIARSYSLTALLVCLLCMQMRSNSNPFLFAVLAGLLANTSIPGLVLAAGLVVVYLISFRRQPHRQWRSLAPAAVVLSLLVLFAIYTAVPPPDVTYGIGPRLAAHVPVARLLSRITGVPIPQHPIEIPPNLDATGRPVSHVLSARLSRALVRFLAFPLFSVSSSNLLAGLFFAVLLVWLTVQHKLYSSIPLLFTLAGAFLLSLGDHHTFLIPITVMAVAWIAWADHAPAAASSSWNRAFVLVFAAVLVEQAAWTVHAARFDIRHPFDPGKAAAEFLLPRAPAHRIANLAFDDTAIEPYADQNLFSNQHSAYWPWKSSEDTDSLRSIAETVRRHPDFIVDAEVRIGTVSPQKQITRAGTSWTIMGPVEPKKYVLLHQYGYFETHRFCGLQPAQFHYSRIGCDVIYEPTQVRAAAPFPE